MSGTYGGAADIWSSNRTMYVIPPVSKSLRKHTFSGTAVIRLKKDFVKNYLQ